MALQSAGDEVEAISPGKSHHLLVCKIFAPFGKFFINALEIY